MSKTLASVKLGSLKDKLLATPTKVEKESVVEKIIKAVKPSK